MAKTTDIEVMRRALMRISGIASNAGRTERDEEFFGTIEAIARDALGQSHGVWEWRLGRIWKKWEPRVH
jgi:hypothetical protein